jgi:hypothetical protein
MKLKLIEFSNALNRRILQVSHDSKKDLRAKDY